MLSNTRIPYCFTANMPLHYMSMALVRILVDGYSLLCHV
jgi:hypothetical protein